MHQGYPKTVQSQFYLGALACNVQSVMFECLLTTIYDLLYEVLTSERS